MAYFDAVYFLASASGTGDFGVASAVQGYRTPAAASVPNGAVGGYRAESSDLSQWEIGVFTYSTTGPTVARTTVIANSLGTTAKINFTTAPNVGLVELSQDLTNASLLLTGTVNPNRLGSGVVGAGLKYLADDSNFKTVVSPLDFRNVLCANGGMEVWQRGAGGSASIAVVASTTFQYTADRWFLLTGANQASVVAQIAGLSTQSRWAARVRRNSGQTGTGVMRFEYPLTTDEVVALRGQNITFQAWLATGANWSPSSGNLVVNAYFGTGAQGRRGATSYTGETNPLTTTLAIAAGTAAAQYTFTGGSTVATNATQGCLQFSWTPVGTAGAADDFSVDDVQLETGVTATTFERLPFDEALRQCQRHYCKTFPYATAPAQNVGLNGSLSAAVSVTVAGDPSGADVTWRFPVAMQTTPTVTTFCPSAANSNWANTVDNNTSVAAVVANTGDAGTNISNGGSGGGASSGSSRVVYIHATADARL